jgi:hypothetical protein
MNSKVAGRGERGAVTIFVTIIMLLLLTVMILAAYAVSTTNLQMVGNVQVREQAIAAANYVIESRLSSNFTAAPTALDDERVSMVADPNNPISPGDYLVDLLAPTCVRATRVIRTAASSVSLPGMTFGSGWDTIWELDATARNEASGAQARVVQGVRVQLTDAERADRCPDV